MDNNKLAKEWFDSAGSNYQYAEVGLKGKDVFPQVAFLSQQAAEKYLKGFLVLNNIKPPHSHELPQLLDKCAKINGSLERLRDACELLSGFYIETRYPPDIPGYTKEDLSQALENAKLIKDTIRSIALIT